MNNNINSAKSKAKTNEEAKPANASKGNLVFLKNDGDKHHKRDVYLVTDTDEKNQTASICKIINQFCNQPANFHPHNFTYEVKQTHIYLAPSQPIEI